MGEAASSYDAAVSPDTCDYFDSVSAENRPEGVQELESEDDRQEIGQQEVGNPPNCGAVVNVVIDEHAQDRLCLSQRSPG